MALPHISSMFSITVPVVAFLLVLPGISRGHQPQATQLRALQLQAATPIEKQEQFGDVSCMRWTGGVCRFSECKSERGPTVCEDGMCKCPPGSCATAEGVCEQQPGEWKGSFSIKFTNPYEDNFAYLSVNPTSHMSTALLRYTHATMGSSDSSPLWKIVLLPRNHVRLESVEYPGHVLTMRTHKGHIYPVINVYEEEKPSVVTFVVHETGDGALEIYHPESQLVLSSGERFFWDSDARSGVVECSHGMSAYPAAPNCDGHEVVNFTPNLPSEVMSSDSRKPLKVINPLYMWQFFAAVGLLIFICCVARLSCWPAITQRRHAATTASNASVVASLDLLHQKVNELEGKLSQSMIAETMLISLTEKIDAMSEQICTPESTPRKSFTRGTSIKSEPPTDNSTTAELYDIFEHSSHVGVQTDCYDITSVENAGANGVEDCVTADQSVFRVDSVSIDHVNRAEDDAEHESTVLSRWFHMVQCKVQSNRKFHVKLDLNLHGMQGITEAHEVKTSQTGRT